MQASYVPIDIPTIYIKEWSNTKHEQEPHDITHDIISVGHMYVHLCNMSQS